MAARAHRPDEGCELTGESRRESLLAPRLLGDAVTEENKRRESRVEGHAGELVQARVYVAVGRQRQTRRRELARCRGVSTGERYRSSASSTATVRTRP
jgi:hypothetical protein